MGLPKKTLLVLPNPWALIHPDHGPVGVCTRDTGGRGGPVVYVGAEARSEVTEKREPGDLRGSRQITWFEYPGLNADLTNGEGVSVPNTPYYRDRLHDGSLVAADKTTLTVAGGPEKCKFSSLSEAKKAAVAEFDAHLGDGTWKELEALLAAEAKVDAVVVESSGNKKSTARGDGAGQ